MSNFIHIEGHRIAYTTAGSSSNPPIIFVHGLMSHRGLWNSTIEKLKDRFFCVAYDQLGFGDSDKPKDGDYSIQKQAERVLKVADHFGIDKFMVAGHSMGGQISAYLTAVTAPERVQKLIFVDGVVTGDLSDHLQRVTRRMVKLADKLPLLFYLSSPSRVWKPYAYWMFQSWLHKIKEIPFDMWAIDRHHATRSDIVHSTSKAWDALNATDLTPHLGKITTPTIIIFGKQDGTVPIERAYLFKEKCTTAQLVVFDNCGHCPMYENFDAYIAAVENFLKA
jgi:pimeloyl-ACP methyl ester carboxylesterase